MHDNKPLCIAFLIRFFLFPTELRFDLATIELKSTPYPNGSVLLSWAWHDDATTPVTDLVAGYHLRGTSKGHTFQKTLSPLLTNYTANCLHGYTEYDISLQPFFKVEDSPTAEELLGEAATVKVKTPASGPVNLTARPLDSTRAAISWSAPSPAEYFLVNLNSTIAENAPDVPPGLPAQPSGCGVQANPIDAFQLEGSSEEWSEYSLPLLGLRPLCKYWVNVKACSTFSCSEVVVVQFEATQEPLRAPSFTSVEAVGGHSIQLQWELSLLHYADIPSYEVRLYDGETFRSLSTANTTLRVANLTAETTYVVEVRAFFEGTRRKGPPARTTVTTWTSRKACSFC
ncbi:hypothetical protein HPB48_000952 [Haemaphysalis longicornis]|uniref:Fibronectin type-III domain-containing protein n=1 Tax=Haemaphysalis longicornis TaxID=44386 RepID=A0A9J6FCQ7_HAELO|nr:hypothetical protein HPB48_000952 [Haemaphysalis longicornis]